MSATSSVRVFGGKSSETSNYIFSGKTLFTIGDDDEKIQIASMDNMLNLEMFHDRNKSTLLQAYVVVREVKITFQTSSKFREQHRVEFRPTSIIYAKDMLEAINIFEESSTKRTWLPDHDPQQSQIGLERLRNKTSLVRIELMSKDMILSKGDK